MYQALYRKYRPRTFSDVTGQDHVTVTLRRQIISGRQSHAYLFVGTRGTGKTSCAKILSRAINCQNPVDGDPCNKCPSCIGIENGSILDVLELDAASNNGVDDVRALRDEAIYSPATVSKRIYIIDEAHMLSNPAFNALLKILEEPPEHLVFILATTALHKVPATILSRCQRFSFKRISPAAIALRLHYIAEQEGFTLTEDAAKELAALADGSMRDAISLLDQCASDTIVDLLRVLDTIGLVGRQDILGMVEAIAARDAVKALDILDKTYSNGMDMSSLLSEMASLLRDILVFKLSPDSPLQSGGFKHTELSAFSAILAPERLFSFLEVIRGAVNSLSRGANVKLTVEMSLIRMCDERLSDDAPALLSRISRLEDVAELRNVESRIQNPEFKGAESRMQNAELKGEDNSSIPNSDEVFWLSILDLLKRDISIYSLLSDSSKIQAERKDNTLIIRAGDMFTISLVESPRFADPLKDAAIKVIGENAVVRVEASGGYTDEKKTKKIDELDKFSIVKFE